MTQTEKESTINEASVTPVTPTTTPAEESHSEVLEDAATTPVMDESISEITSEDILTASAEQENAEQAVENIAEAVQSGVDSDQEVKTITTLMNSGGPKNFTTTQGTIGEFLTEQGVELSSALVTAIPQPSTGLPQVSSFIQNFDEPLSQDLIYNITSRNVTGGN